MSATAMPRPRRPRLRGLRRAVRAGELAHVLLCAAVSLPLALVAAIGSPLSGVWPSTLGAALPPLMSFLTLALVAALTLARFVRPVEIALARTLLGVPLPDPVAAPTLGSRMLGATWFLACAMIGYVVVTTVAVLVPLAATLIASPVTGGRDVSILGLPAVALPGPALPWMGMVAGFALAAVAALAVPTAGRGLTALAPVLLGPTDADRHVLEERRTANTARANAIARELHDSMGHALSAIAVQASAARAGRPADADESLAAIESLARGALEELDGALGALRRGAAAEPQSGGSGGGAPGARPTPRDAAPPSATLDTVLATAHRVLDLDVRVDDLSGLPPDVSAACVRLVQEALTNVVRHGDGTALVRIERDDAAVRIRVRNRIGDTPLPGGGGRGLEGMRERAMLLDGRVSAGPAGDGEWQLDAQLPVAGDWPVGGAA